MTTVIKLPEVGENVASASVVRILVGKGDALTADQPMLEIETDKATLEVPATTGGTIKKVLIKEGDKVAVGQPIFELEEGGTAAKTEKPAAEKSEPSAPAKSSPQSAPEPPRAPARAAAGQTMLINLPEVGENIEKATLVRVNIKAGDTIKAGQPILEIETDKATLEVPAEASGLVLKVMVREGEQVKIGQPVMELQLGAGASRPAAAEQPAPAAEPAPSPSPKADPPPAPAGRPTEPKPRLAELPWKTAAAAPSVRRLAREIGVDIATVKGTGPGGRIGADDVKMHSRQAHQTARQTSKVGVATLPGMALPDFTRWGAVERKPVSNIRRVIGERLGYAWATIPHVHQMDKADITDLEQARRSYNARQPKGGVKLTVTAILIKLAARMLARYPEFNTSLDAAAGELVYKQYYHVGVAVDTERGLVVPVVRDADRKSIRAISEELTALSTKARDGKLTLEEMQGATFTISNLGGVGGTSFNPIINPPEVAIVGVARTQNELTLRDGQVVERLMLPVTVGYDHRVIDGADGARFTRDLVEMLANPFDLLVEM